MKKEDEIRRICAYCKYRDGTYCMLHKKEVMPDMSCPNFAPRR